MFTGIITEIGKVTNIQKISNNIYYTISCQTLQNDLKIGESVACNGICLTIVEFTHLNITVEVSKQTLKVTTVNKWKINKNINLERATSLKDRLNGHLVQGHIDTTVQLKNKYCLQGTDYYEFNYPQECSDLIVEHGSICIDGISLTIAQLNNNTFHVALISHTINNTNLKSLKINESVNIEFDIIGKYVQRSLTMVKKKAKDRMSEEWLLNNGF